MAKNTYCIKVWHGADTYREAVRNGTGISNYKEPVGYDFYRVGVKRVKTCLRYLAGWRKQALENGWQSLYGTLCRDDGHYEIEDTSVSWDGKVVASGMIKDLDKLSNAA